MILTGIGIFIVVIIIIDIVIWRKRIKMKDKRERNDIRRMSQEDIDKSLEDLFKGQRKVPTVIEERKNLPGGNEPQFPSQFSPQKRPQLSIKIPDPEPEEDEPYWSAEEWEKWAYAMYKQYPSTKQFLPQWFLEAVAE